MASAKAVLMIEDEAQVRGFLGQLLEKSGWAVSTVGNGTEGLAALASTRFDVVLCDLDLGRGPNGLDVLRQMPEKSKGTPLVILTAHGTIDRCLDAIRAGAADFLEKPFSEQRLLSSLDRATNARSSAIASGETHDPLWTDSVGDKHIRRALRVIEREVANPSFSIELLANSIGLTPDHLGRLFRAHLGRTPLECVHRTRIAVAEQKLLTSTASIHEIAFDCGYRDGTELGSWFRRLKGMTPSQWRQARGPLAPMSDLA